MTIQRDLWQTSFTEADPPRWPCPVCSHGSLSVVSGTLHKHETKESWESRDHEAWEPSWIVELFGCVLGCARANCKAQIQVAGRGYLDEIYIPDPHNPYNHLGIQHEIRFKPSYVDPPPALFLIPVKCPDLVRVEIISAFALYWFDIDASANKLRSALEALMDSLKIKRSVIGKKGRKRRLDLHQRIELLRPKHEDVVDHLLAAKWIGNFGTHSHKLTVDDLFDAMEMLESALDELILKKSKTLKKVAKQIQANKGPRKRAASSLF